ncbi:MAG: cryptochrome/photolyase family protein [Sphingobacteriales bacterium]|nr:MAG: cryptochrome/photolyase family protein [Sphingobacteriales bacterium]
MKAATIIFPHQLYQAHPALKKTIPVYLVEEYLFFNQYLFHKQKLVLHRAAMKAYQAQLEENGYKVAYVEATTNESDIRILIPNLAAAGFNHIIYTEPADNWLQKHITTACEENKLSMEVLLNPNFLNEVAPVKDFFKNKRTYFQTDFYTWQRKQRNILLDAANKPLGGKWSFDAENREKLPAKHTVAPISFPLLNNFVKEAQHYVASNFANNFGSLQLKIDQQPVNYFYPTTHKEAIEWLQQFLKTRFTLFGTYEDAMQPAAHFLYHSVLTPMLNIGLLQPQQVIDAALEYASQHDVPLNSLEGFIRQIMGWREFIRSVYALEGGRQRTTNYWKFTRKIPAAFWQGNTGIVPVDSTIKKLLDTGYNHHIERLMILGNFFLLCEFDPNEVYLWFMEMYIDSYDWVMVPNVYGMTQFADGGLMTTKPYISGSNYLMKMGPWPKGDWQQIWDGLFWRFMHTHRNFFLTNPRLGMLVKTFDKMSTEKQQQHLTIAENFLKGLDA